MVIVGIILLICAGMLLFSSYKLMEQSTDNLVIASILLVISALPTALGVFLLMPKMLLF